MAKDKTNEDKLLEVARKNLEGFLQSASAIEPPHYITTGHLALDLAIGMGVSPEEEEKIDFSSIDFKNAGGFPFGKLVEISGQEGSGKSSLAYRVVANAQRAGYKCGWIDSERSFSKSLAKINGVDLNELSLSVMEDLEQPDHLYSAEEVFDRICDMCRVGYKVIVLDSVANLSTKAELDNYISEGGVGMASLASVLSKSLKRVINYAAKYGTLIVCINQLREKIGQLFGNPEHTPGGRALKFLASLRIKMQKQSGEKGAIEVEVENEAGDMVKRTVGGNTYVYILKNRFAKPVSDSIIIPVYHMLYSPGFDDIVFNEGRKTKVIGKHLKMFRWNDVKIEGRKEFMNHIRANKLLGALIEEIKNESNSQKVIVAPEIMYFNEEEAENIEMMGQVIEIDGKEVEIPSQNDSRTNRTRKKKDS